MKLRAGYVVSAGLLLATAANAEMRVPDQGGWSPFLRQVSDFVEPDAAIQPQMPPARYARALLPPQEVYEVLRDAGFSPLSGPRLRGNIWTIAAINREGDDGRLFIDARNGRILSFMPVNFDDDPSAIYGPQAAPPRPMSMPMPSVRAIERPPASIPRVASRTMPMPQPVMPQPPMPKPVPPAAAVAKPVAPAPAQSAVVETRPLAAPVALPPPAPTPSTVGQAKSGPQILPTQPIPNAQDLEY